ncbi:hypothetical protein KGF57_004399 [Candida theae]|uniref:Nodulin-like domain-containing protein n=1 Tax=Candida theae TaxID=1198502 RepID=A0AAD5BBQ1_9ASCO|nr:uncharacterized protein KGF57_004399 [Candida theae]KAI5950054.1 hypothetical protein KGF57_004399 [Candida theae]
MSQTLEQQQQHHHAKQMSTHFPKRLTALLVSVFVALASGTPYMYGVYSPQFVKHIGLTASHSATISLATNIGSGIGGLPGGLLIDHFGPQFSIFIGSLCIFVGYFTVFKIYYHQYSNMFVICIAMALMGFGSITSYFATLKASQANFPKHKGVAGALPVSCFGFSATVFSIISASFFKDDTGGLLQFLAFFCGSVTLLGSFFVHVYVSDDEEDEREHHNRLESNNESGTNQALLSDAEASLISDIEPPPQSLSRSESLNGSFSFWGIGSRTPSSSISLQDSEATELRQSLIEEERLGKQRKAKVSPLETIKRRLVDKVYLIHYFIVSITAGVGQVYIYSVGFIVAAQYYYNKEHEEHARNSIFGRAVQIALHDPDAASIQALQVSILSIASFLGRLVAGFLSDYIHKSWHIQRLWIVLATLLILSLAQYITISNVSSFHWTAVASGLTGACYGLVFGTYPAIIADSFGTKTFSTNWGLICTGPLVTLYALNKYFGWIYDSQSDTETGICSLGNGCYKGAFELSLILCSIAFVVSGASLKYLIGICAQHAFLLREKVEQYCGVEARLSLDGLWYSPESQHCVHGEDRCFQRQERPAFYTLVLLELPCTHKVAKVDAKRGNHGTKKGKNFAEILEAGCSFVSKPS